jgi:hypothetical protein
MKQLAEFKPKCQAWFYVLPVFVFGLLEGFLKTSGNSQDFAFTCFWHTLWK